jgi:hypothetical protein
MDNIDEIRPDFLIIDSSAYPRHWKIIVQFVRESGDMENPISVVLFRDAKWTSEDKNKALFLGVDLVLSVDFENRSENDEFRSLLMRKLPQTTSFWEKTERNMGLVFTNPMTGMLITGNIAGLTTESVSFSPRVSALTETIPLGVELYACSLRVGENILSPTLRLRNRDSVLHFDFVSFPGKEEIIFQNYIELQ